MRLRQIFILCAAGVAVCGGARAARDDHPTVPAWAAPEQAPASAASQKPKQGPLSLITEPKSAESAAAPIDFSADSLQYSANQTLVIARGNVVVKQGSDKATADYMTLNRDTGEIYAQGNVVVTSGERIWKGDQLTYNYKTKVGWPGPFRAYIPPYYITAEDSRKTSATTMELSGVTITTCDGENPESSMKLREAVLSENDDGNKVLTGKGVTVEWQGMPVMWMPKFSRVLATHDAWFEFMPGYGNRQGAFLLTAYNVHLGKEVLSTTRLDGRTKRGIGVGQDFTWKDQSKDAQGHKNNLWEGEFSSYYMNDNEPFKDAKEELRYGEVEDSTRYRLKLSHRQTFDSRDYFIGSANYLSDPNILDDFFNDEYRHGVQPENRATLTHRGDNYTASIEINKRLNDFYENVDRLPELRLDVNRIELGNSGLYYESHNSGGYLERVYPEGGTNYLAAIGSGTSLTNYDAFRVDSQHKIFYPTRHFGFLNVTPRLGYDGTFYSTTYQDQKKSEVVINTDSNGVASITTNTTTSRVDAGSDLRNLYEIGGEVSFKAFRAWNDLIVLDGGDGLRHVAEPYLDYTYNPEPNLLPSALPQFDRIDTLNKRNDIRIGMRNKLQTRHNKRVWDIVDADVWTYYRVEKLSPDQEDFDFIFSHTELRPMRQLPIDFDLAYDAYNNEINQFATQAAYLSTDGSRFGTEYRFRQDGEDFITPFILLSPNGKVGLEASWRHDFDRQRLEEQSYFVRWNTSCMSYGLGVRQNDNDLQVWGMVSLLAFPQSHLNLGR